MADSTVTLATSLLGTNGTVDAGDTRTINVNDGVIRCWTYGPGYFPPFVNDTSFTVGGALVFNLGKGSAISLGGWGSTTTGATINAGGYVTVNGSGERSTANGAADQSAVGFFNIAGKTVNNGTIDLNNTTLFNYNFNSAVTGSGTIKLTNVTIAESTTSQDWNNPSFASIDGQTLILTNSQIVMGTADGGSATNLSIVLNGNSNYVAFRQKTFVQGVKIRGFGKGDILDFAVPGASDQWAYDSSTGILQIRYSPNGGAASLISIDLGLGYDPDLFKQVLIPGTTSEYGVQYAGATPCYLAGTLIRTGSGEKAVEEIGVGDMIVVLENNRQTLRPVIWTGSRRIHVTEGQNHPVVIRQHAFGPNVPDRELRVTEEHCFFFRDRFIPVRMLVNGSSIFHDTALESYDIFHIELAQHAVIYANNTLSESFLNTGNHGTTGSPTAVKSWGRDTSYPLSTDRQFVEPVFRELAARAEALGMPQAASSSETSPEERTRVALLINGHHIVNPSRVSGRSFVFPVDRVIDTVRIVSDTARPDRVIGPFCDDRRELGLLVGEVLLFSSRDASRIDAHLSESEALGWCDLENENSRWTRGDALIPGLSSSDERNVIAVEIFDTSLYSLARSGEIIYATGH